jgi:hypothetical protein
MAPRSLRFGDDGFDLTPHVEDSDDFDSFGGGEVENDVVVAREAAEVSKEFRADSSHL